MQSRLNLITWKITLQRQNAENAPKVPNMRQTQHLYSEGEKLK
jgi:hypothetical protein